MELPPAPGSRVNLRFQLLSGQCAALDCWINGKKYAFTRKQDTDSQNGCTVNSQAPPQALSMPRPCPEMRPVGWRSWVNLRLFVEVSPHCLTRVLYLVFLCCSLSAAFEEFSVCFGEQSLIRSAFSTYSLQEQAHRQAVFKWWAQSCPSWEAG